MTDQCHWKDSLPYSQAMLIKRISSNQLDSNNSLKELKQLRKTRAPFTTNQRTPFKDRFTGQDWPYYGKIHTNTNLDKEILRERRRIQRENFWIQKLEILYLKELNQELNKS